MPEYVQTPACDYELNTSLMFEPDQRPAGFVRIDPFDPLEIKVETIDRDAIGDYTV